MRGALIFWKASARLFYHPQSLWYVELGQFFSHRTVQTFSQNFARAGWMLFLFSENIIKTLLLSENVCGRVQLWRSASFFCDD